MLRLIEDEEKFRYPLLDISDMLDEDDEFDNELEDEFADEFDTLFEEVDYIYYDEGSEEEIGEERRKRILH